MVLGKIRSPGLAAFATIRSPSFSISAAGTGNLRPLFCHRLPLSLKPRWGWEHPHDIDIIEQIAILRIRHFLLAATRVQEIAHPQFFIVIRRQEKVRRHHICLSGFVFLGCELPHLNRHVYGCRGNPSRDGISALGVQNVNDPVAQ